MIEKLPDIERDEMQAGIEHLKRMLPQVNEHTVLIAKVKRAAYLAFVAEGFTESEALELTKTYP